MRLAHISAKLWLIATLALCCGALRPVHAQAHSATPPAPATQPATHTAHPSSATKPKAKTKAQTNAKSTPQTNAKPKPQHPKAAKPVKPAESAKAKTSTKAKKPVPTTKPKKVPAKAVPAASTAAAPASAVAQAQPAAPAEPIENKRDPFLPLLRPKSTGGGGEHLPPGKAGLVVSTVRIDGTVEEQNQMIAVVSNPEDKVYFIREGDRLYDGEVEKINLDGVTFKETSKDAFGKPVERTVTKRIYASAGEAQ